MNEKKWRQNLELEKQARQRLNLEYKNEQRVMGLLLHTLAYRIAY